MSQRASRFSEINKVFNEEGDIVGTADFFSKLKETSVETNLGYTENGALAYNTTGSELVDFDFNTSSMRQATTEEIASQFEKVFYENKETAMRYLFYVGDIREGKGERHIFNEVLKHLANTNYELAKAVLPLIPEYGRWDEVSNLVTTPLKDDVIKMIKEQIDQDVKDMSVGKPVSLCAKWLPSINASKKETIKKALIISEGLGLDKKQYRKLLSGLRDHLNIIEKALAEKDTEKLAEMQESLTSKQNYKYAKALMNLIPEERKAYFDKVLKGEANFNVDVLEPHEIYFRYEHELDKEPNTSYEMMWKMLPNKVIDGNDILVIRDGSGSMTRPIPGTNNGTILDVASALTVYFSEHAKGGFHNKFITFSAHPELVDISKCDTLHDKIRHLSNYCDCTNTNIEKTFDLILETAVKNKMTQDELPKSLLIVSDMQFDAATSGGYDWETRSYYEAKYDETLFNTIRKNFESYGYEIPRLIFWNVSAEKTTIPEIKNDLGLVLLSGYSKNIMDMICENNFEMEIVNEEGKKETVQLTPEQILSNKVYSERYDAVSKAIRPVLEKDKIYSSEER